MKIMAATTPGRTQGLLQQAERQNDSSTPEDSSVTVATRVFPSVEAAEKAFSRFHKKLLQIERWNAHSEISSFELFDKSGGAQNEKIARVGDYIKVTLPGSGKDDWVKITEIDESPDEIILIVKPSHDPTSAENAETTSHFFTAAATNNLCLQKENSTINFYTVGLNEKANTTETGGILETVRNYATANLGCFLGIQKAHWKTFCDNFLEIEK